MFIQMESTEPVRRDQPIQRLLRRVETFFQVKLPDEVALSIETPGQLMDAVLDRMGMCLEHYGPSSQALFLLRQRIEELIGLPALSIEPDEKMDNLFPRRRRRKQWTRLRRELDLYLPGLARPPLLLNALILLSLGLMGTLVFWLTRSWGLGFMGAITVAMAVPIGLGFLTQSFATRFPYECETVRGSVEAMLRYNYTKLANRPLIIDAEEVWHSLRSLIAETMGIPVEAVTPDTRWGCIQR